MLEDVISAVAPVAPFTDDASKVVIDEAVASLGALRALQWLGDGATQLHLLASLRDQIDLALGDAAALAREQNHTEIVDLTTRAETESEVPTSEH